MQFGEIWSATVVCLQEGEAFGVVKSGQAGSANLIAELPGYVGERLGPKSPPQVSSITVQ